MHAVLRGHDRQACFFADMDRRVFLKYLSEASLRTECELHAYVLMTNHVHLLVCGHERLAVSRLMHSVARRYSAYVNRRQRRSGSLYEGRFRSTPIRDGRRFLACMRYIELNPVRAGLVAHPSRYPWSSFRANASGMPSGLLVPHPEYLELGGDQKARADAYRRLFHHPLPQAELDEFRRGVNPGPRGRPRKEAAAGGDLDVRETNLVLF